MLWLASREEEPGEEEPGRLLESDIIRLFLPQIGTIIKNSEEIAPGLQPRTQAYTTRLATKERNSNKGIAQCDDGMNVDGDRCPHINIHSQT